MRKKIFSRNDLDKEINELHETAILFEKTEIFLQDLKAHYPTAITVLGFKNLMADHFENFKYEVEENLKRLEEQKKLLYLNKLKIDIERNRSHVKVAADTILKWNAKYDKDEGESSNLYTFLLSSKPSKDAFLEDDFNPDISSIQNDFFNYYHHSAIDAATDFIVKQINEIEINLKELGDINLKRNKLKTHLSVPEIALLFKLLNELKPKIFDLKSEAELHRFISANFMTKKSSEAGISPNKLKNLFNTPEKNAVDFWLTHLSTMQALLKKI